MIEIKINDEGTFSVYKNGDFLEMVESVNIKKLTLDEILGSYIIQLLYENSSQIIRVGKNNCVRNCEM